MEEMLVEDSGGSGGSLSSQNKRPRSESPSLPDDQAEGEEESEVEGEEESEVEGGGEEEDAQSSGSEPATDTTTDPPVITPFDWSNTTPAEPLTIDVRVPRRTWYWFSTWRLQDVKAMRPCDKKWTKEDQRQLLASVKRVLAQPHHVDCEYVVVTEQYSTAKSGFAGRLNSSGVQGLQGQIRANLLAETADIDMSTCMHRILLWVCKQFNIATPQLEYYVRHRDGPTGMLQCVMEQANVSKAKAKELYTMAYTWHKPISVSSPFFKNLDKEAKEVVQKKLMQVLELQWIKQFCTEDNRPGSFIAHLFQWIECRLVVPVSQVVSTEFNTTVAALVFDGFNVADASLHGNQDVLDRAHAVCEQICPGIDMRWTWKELDFMVKSKDTRKPLKELRVPDSFVAPPVGSPEAAALEEEYTFGPEEYTYEQMRAWFSLGFDGAYGKVGSTYIKKEEDGKVTCIDERRMKSQHKHEKYWELKDELNEETGVTTKVKTKKPFIEAWMMDERMDPKYLPDEKKHEHYYWDRFDMFPDASKCRGVYNLWSGFAAEEMSTDLNDEGVQGSCAAARTLQDDVQRQHGAVQLPARPVRAHGAVPRREEWHRDLSCWQARL